MAQRGDSEGDIRVSKGLVDPAVIAQFVDLVEPGGEVSLSVVLSTVAFSLLVVFGTTAWWMLH